MMMVSYGYGIFLTIVFTMAIIDSIYFRFRYRRLQRRHIAVVGLITEGAWEVVDARENLREAARLVKGAMDGHQLIVTKPPEGMTLDEAQRDIDRAVGIFYKPKGRA